MIIKWALKQNGNWIAKHPIAFTWICTQAMLHFGKHLPRKKAFKYLFLFETVLMELIHTMCKAGKKILLHRISEQHSEQKWLRDFQYCHYLLCYISTRVYQPNRIRLIWYQGVRHTYRECLLHEQPHSIQQAKLWQPAATGAGDGTVMSLQERAVGKPLPQRSTTPGLSGWEATTLDTFARSSDEC